MKLYNVTFSIYANNEQEARDAGAALDIMREEMLQLDTVATAPHLTAAIRNWKSNALVRNRIIRHFPKLKRK